MTHGIEPYLAGTFGVAGLIVLLVPGGQKTMGSGPRKGLAVFDFALAAMFVAVYCDGLSRTGFAIGAALLFVGLCFFAQSDLRRLRTNPEAMSLEAEAIERLRRKVGTVGERR